MNDNQPQTKIKKLKHLRYPLTPYQLFSPVSTVFLDNLTYEEQLLGLYKLYDEFIMRYNEIIPIIQELQEWVDKLPDELNAIKASITSLQTQLLNAINTFNTQLTIIRQSIITGDDNTLAAANKYTDEQIAKLPGGGSGSGTAIRYGGLTAEEYDYLGLEAVDYDDLGLTAYEYDNYAKYILLGQDGSIFLKFSNSIQINAGETVFEIPAGLPIQLGKRYQFEISLGTFSLNGEENAHLEIVGMNTLGNTLPISVPSGGSATVAGVFSVAPSQVRAMSDQTQITAYNAYLKIKPLGEL